MVGWGTARPRTCNPEGATWERENRGGTTTSGPVLGEPRLEPQSADQLLPGWRLDALERPLNPHRAAAAVGLLPCWQWQNSCQNSCHFVPRSPPRGVRIRVRICGMLCHARRRGEPFAMSPTWSRWWIDERARRGSQATSPLLGNGRRRRGGQRQWDRHSHGQAAAGRYDGRGQATRRPFRAEAIAAAKPCLAAAPPRDPL